MEINQNNQKGDNKISFDVKEDFQVSTIKSFQNEDQIRKYIKNNNVATIVSILIALGSLLFAAADYFFK